MCRFAFWGNATLSTSTHRHYDESVHRIKQHTRGNNTIPYHYRDFSDILNSTTTCTSSSMDVISRELDSFRAAVENCTHSAQQSRIGLIRSIAPAFRYMPVPLLKPRYKCQFGSNSLLFTAFKTV